MPGMYEEVSHSPGMGCANGSCRLHSPPLTPSAHTMQTAAIAKSFCLGSQPVFWGTCLGAGQ
eukprot:2993589-Prorocentrum_lima.AAC.1